jgi:glycosyltransferase involved in cell wall biosynthesis
MKELAEQQGVEHACRFPGTVPKDTARRYAENADVLVTPRRIGNNTPLKIYEWLASGIPIVATNIRAHTQVLDERVSVLVDPEPGAIARGVLRVLRDPEHAERIGAAAQSLHRQRYSRAVYERKIRDLFGALN